MSRSRAEYARRVNRAIDHLEAGLPNVPPLEEMAAVANFSPFHFHRIFRALTGEPVHGFAQRLRLERAARRLVEEAECPVSDVAYDAGFSSPSTFARAFRARFGMSATDFRKERKAIRNQGEHVRNDGEDPQRARFYLHPETRRPHWEVNMDGMKADVKIEDLGARRVAYVRHTGDYRENAGEVFGDLWGRLMPWAGARGLFPGAQTLCVFHDDPEVTDGARLRVSVCVELPDGVEPSGEVGEMQIAGGTYAVARFVIPVWESGRAWRAVFEGWLPDSGFVPDDRLCFETYGAGELSSREVFVHVPVRPL